MMTGQLLGRLVRPYKGFWLPGPLVVLLQIPDVVHVLLIQAYQIVVGAFVVLFFLC